MQVIRARLTYESLADRVRCESNREGLATEAFSRSVVDPSIRTRAG